MLEEDAEINKFWNSIKQGLRINRASYMFMFDEKDTNLIPNILKDDYETFKDKVHIDYENHSLSAEMTIHEFLSKTKFSTKFILSKIGVDENGVEWFEITYYDYYVE